jgi:hypothetical protein
MIARRTEEGFDFRPAHPLLDAVEVILNDPARLRPRHDYPGDE